jgi:glutamine amidotransferase
VIVVVDYGMGNLRSAQKGLEKAGHEAVISQDPRDVEKAAAVVLPGVGAFADCYEGLRSCGLVEPVREAAQSGKPFLGICVGMQLLFDESEEGRGSKGLGIFPGTVARFPDPGDSGLKVPHMGWNKLTPTKDDPVLLDGLTDPYVYFVHSYYVKPADDDLIIATSDHGIEFAAIVGRGNIYAVQFHPEKSQRTGITILKAFGDLAKVNS